MSHTKGPWSTNHVGFTHAKNGACIAEVGIDVLPFEEVEANAKLIDAAPDLLEALEDLKREIILSDIDMAYIDSHFKKWLEKAASAIAKAKGTAQ